MAGSSFKNVFRNSRSSLPVLILVLLSLSVAAEAKDPQLVPRRVISVGDSFSLGWNAEMRGPNGNASWVNGYYGRPQWLNGLTNVRSHNQRISNIWGNADRRNFTSASAGASMTTLVQQAWDAVDQEAQYVTILLGHGDVCQEQPWMIPSDELFEAMFREGMGVLSEGLPLGATIYVLAIVDMGQLWDIGKMKKSMGIVDCMRIWSSDRFPCDTMFHPLNSDADREYTRSRIVAFNAILERVTGNYQELDDGHYYCFTDTPFMNQFSEGEISDFDCFHLSAAGQKKLAQITWDDAPFIQSQK